MRSAPLALTVALVAALAACEGQHDDLGQTTSATSGTGGAGGAGATVGSGGSGTIVEPDGPPRWTFVNGVVDRDAIGLCFLESPADPSDLAAPWPAGGLAFARSASIALPSAPVPAGSDVELVLLSGDLDALGNTTCREIADDPGLVSGVDVVSLGVLPADTATRPRSLVFVPNGCLGGVDHLDANDDLVCGTGYAPELPTPGLVVAPISRVVFAEYVGLQAVHGAPVGPLDVWVTPSFDGAAPQLMTSALVAGQVAPFPPWAPLSIAELGSSSGPHLTTYPTGTMGAHDDATFGAALDRGGLSPSDVANGKNVAFVGVGAQPGLPVGAWWHAFAWVAVRPD